MLKIVPSERFNYIAFFLTLSCNLKCSYCINLHGDIQRIEQSRRNPMTGNKWIDAVNRLDLKDDLPLTLQGGEPTLHPNFYRIVNESDQSIKMDLLTNMMFDVEEFIEKVPVERFTRDAPYAAIRVSFHPFQNDINDLVKKAKILENAGFRIGIYVIDHPSNEMKKEIVKAENICTEQEIDFRKKEYLGFYNGKQYGTVKYPDMFNSPTRKVFCRTSELIVDPLGNIFRCHYDLYNNLSPVGHILDPEFNIYTLDEFRSCSNFGKCNLCDVKVTTNRYQEDGHTSVEITGLEQE